MDKLKYIKLENEDGSYSDSIPLAVDSDHVDVNGDTLTNKLSKKASIDLVNSNIANLQNQINSLASGSPKGVYATVTALEQADPEHNGIYIVTENGHWYYYSNGWQDGGIYQSAINPSIEDNSITSAALKDNSVIKSKIGDEKLLAIEEHLENKEGYVINSNVIDSSSTKFKKGTMTHNIGGYVCRAIAIPFIYNSNKQYRYLTIPQFKINNSGFLTIAITTSDNLHDWFYQATYITEEKYYINEGEYENLVIKLNNINYDLLIDGAQYYLCLFSSSNEKNPRYDSLNVIDYTNLNKNTISNFISDVEHCKWLQGSAGWNWMNLNGRSYPELLPAIGLSVENPFTIDYSKVIEIKPESIPDNSITYAKIGDDNLKQIEDFFVKNYVYEIDTSKITNSTTENPGSFTSYLSDAYCKGIAIPFIYHEENQYKYLYTPSLTTLVDGYLTIGFSSQLKGTWAYQTPYETQIKYYLKAGLYQNICIPLDGIDYSTLTDGETYYLYIYQLTTEDNPKAASVSSVRFSKAKPDNINSDWIVHDDNYSPKIILWYGSWAWWTYDFDTQASEMLPKISLCNEYPLILALDKYINTINSGNKLNNKIINFMGDSITQGVDGSTNGHVAENPYPKIIQNMTGAICNNYGIAGSTIGGDGSTVSEITGAIQGFFPMVNRLKDMNKNADINVIWGGTNDALADRRVDLGTINDDSNLTFYGALNNICEYLLTNYPTKTNLLITPFKRGSNPDYKNQYGYKLSDYVDAVIKVGAKFGIPVFNFYDNMGGTPSNATWRTNNLPDGTHPNQDYYYIVANKITNFINANI